MSLSIILINNSLIDISFNVSIESNIYIESLFKRKSVDSEIWGPGNPEMWDTTNQKYQTYHNSNPFGRTCRQALG